MSIAHTDWPADQQAIRFVVLSRPDQRGLQRIRALLWEDGRRTYREHAAHLDNLIASARRRGAVVDVIERLVDERVAA